MEEHHWIYATLRLLALDFVASTLKPFNFHSLDIKHEPRFGRGSIDVVGFRIVSHILQFIFVCAVDYL